LEYILHVPGYPCLHTAFSLTWRSISLSMRHRLWIWDLKYMMVITWYACVISSKMTPLACVSRHSTSNKFAFCVELNERRLFEMEQSLCGLQQQWSIHVSEMGGSWWCATLFLMYVVTSKAIDVIGYFDKIFNIIANFAEHYFYTYQLDTIPLKIRRFRILIEMSNHIRVKR